MKKRFLIGLLICISLFGCGAADNNENADNEMEYLEGYEGLSQEETTQKMIEEADKLEVVPDKTE
ncbi:MAG: hypothetical protein K2M46_01595 [Lachnospiraceae bacterium]|nr:hypothetical protein [Lachnospiraceae bacterium]